MLSKKFLFSALFSSLALAGCGGSKSPDFTAIPNSSPQISASDIVTDEQTTVILRTVVEDDGAIVSYQWQQTAGESVEIEDIDGETAKIKTPTVLLSDGPQTLSFTLTATDNHGAKSSATINVLVNPVNDAPLAKIGGVDNGQTFGFVETLLDGSRSSDSDGQIVSYQWQQVSGEPLSIESLENPQLKFKTPNKAAEYSFQLTVTDNEGAISQSTVSLNNQPYFLEISATDKHYCALMQDKDGKGAYCWGGNNPQNIAIPQLSNPYGLNSNRTDSCVIDNNEVKCWGQLLDGLDEIPAFTNPKQVAIADFHACAMDNDGIKCWGARAAGLNDGPELSNPTQFVTVDDAVCALDDNGVSCWGDQFSSATQVPEMTGVTDLYAGYMHVCAVHEQGLSCWGNEHLQLEIDPTTIAHASLGQQNTCILTTDSQVQCFGGETNLTDAIPAFDEPKMLTSRYNTACAIDNNGVRCWGGDYFGQTEPPEFDSINVMTSAFSFSCAAGQRPDSESEVACWGFHPASPRAFPASDPDTTKEPVLTGVIGLGANDWNACAITDNGPHCWGYEPLDVSGEGDWTMPYSEELSLPAMENVTAIDPGYQSICALADGQVQCWGDEWYYQLDVPTLTNPTQLASGDTFHCAVADEGLQCWGSFWGYDFDHPAPTLNSVTSLSAEDNHACAISEGQVYCWGYNFSAVTDIPALSNPVKVEVAAGNSCAIDDSGVVCWGDNSHGQLQVPALSNPTDLTVGFGYVCAKDDSGLVCWGFQGFGNQPVPTREQVQAGNRKAHAARTTTAELPASMPKHKKQLLGPVM